MSKVFKTIRKSNIMANNSKKYFKYAIGEIILVVIGILIALQINNWNENNKLERKEIELLQLVKQDLIENNKEIKDLEKRLSVNKNGVDSILSIFKKTEKQDNLFLPLSVAMVHRKSNFNNSNTGYKLILNNSTSIISNDSILKSILSLYEKDFSGIIKREELMNSKIDNNLYPLTNSLFRLKPMTIKFEELDASQTDLYEPLDFEALSKNNLYINTLVQLKRTFEERLILSKEIAIKVKSTITSIEDELNSK